MRGEDFIIRQKVLLQAAQEEQDLSAEAKKMKRQESKDLRLSLVILLVALLAIAGFLGERRWSQRGNPGTRTNSAESKR